MLSPFEKELDKYQQVAPDSSSAFFRSAMLLREEASGVPAPRQWVSRLTA
jgi:hypothetical protein